MLLPSPVATDGHVTLTFTYSGLLANEENSPIPGVNTAVISKDGAYLLLPSRWFPLTNYPSNRYTATFRLNVPDTFAVAGTGKTSAPTPMPGKNSVEGGRLLYTFECDNSPRTALSSPAICSSIPSRPKASTSPSTLRERLPQRRRTLPMMWRDPHHFLRHVWPASRSPTFTVIQLPDGTLRDFAAPGVLLLSKRIWDPRGSDRTIARLVASQWWGIAVTPATPGDVWISDGLARYSEALYAEQNAGREAGLKAVDEFAVGALMGEDAAPVAQAARLAPVLQRLPLGGHEQRRDDLSHAARPDGRRRLQIPAPRLLRQVQRQDHHHRRFRKPRTATCRSLRQAGDADTPTPRLLRAVAQFHRRSRLHHRIRRLPHQARASASSAKSSSRSTPSACPSKLRIETEGNPETEDCRRRWHRISLHRRDFRPPQTRRHQDRSQQRHPQRQQLPARPRRHRPRRRTCRARPLLRRHRANISARYRFSPIAR